MPFILAKSFEKDFAKLSKKMQVKVLAALALFGEDADDPRLRVHGLSGQWHSYCSIEVTGDVRAIYFEINEGVARFVAVGTHSQLYG